MNWQKLTVRQFQKLDKLLTSARNNEIEEGELEYEALRIMSGLSVQEINAMDIDQYHDALRTHLAFLDSKPVAYEPIKFITVNGKRYRFIYDIWKIKAHVYIEAKHFEKGGVVSNLHRIAASMCIPQKKVLGIWRDEKYDSSKHEEYANDLLDAPYQAVHSAVIFFCNVYTNSMRASLPFLKAEMMKTKKITENQAEEAITHLCNAMDGFSR